MTANATRKWLMGQAMPTMDKIAVLASMLNASEDWLRWGELSVDEKVNSGLKESGTFTTADLSNPEKSFAQDFKLLTSANKRVVTAVMEVLMKEQQHAKSSPNEA